MTKVNDLRRFIDTNINVNDHEIHMERGSVKYHGPGGRTDVKGPEIRTG